MKKSNKFSPDVRERAVRMVREHCEEDPSLWAAIESIAPKIGCVPQALREWVKRDEVDNGVREGVTTSEPRMVGEFLATIPSQQLPQLGRQRGHGSFERVGHERSTHLTTYNGTVSAPIGPDTPLNLNPPAYRRTLN